MDIYQNFLTTSVKQKTAVAKQNNNRFKQISKLQHKMSECLEYIFCCLFLQTNDRRRVVHGQTDRSNAKKKPQKPKPKPSRIISKYKSEDIVKMTKQQKKSGKLVYTCPICTELFNKILACNSCENNMCRTCVLNYEKKFEDTVQNMKCPFCNSQTSIFIDYQGQPRSYFDTTGKNGFLDPIQRKKIDEEMKLNNMLIRQKSLKSNSSVLQRIQEDAVNENAFPTNLNLEERLNEEDQNNQGNHQNSISRFRSISIRITNPPQNHNFTSTV